MCAMRYRGFEGDGRRSSHRGRGGGDDISHGVIDVIVRAAAPAAMRCAWIECPKRRRSRRLEETSADWTVCKKVCDRLQLYR
jgi:hypothetical protein